jgi:hypothetical protein
MACMTKAHGEKSKSLQDSDPNWAACLFLRRLAVWNEVQRGSGKWRSGGASEGVWLKSQREKKLFKKRLKAVSEITAMLDNEVSCARENLSKAGVDAWPHSSDKEANEKLCKYVPRCTE